MKRFLFDGFDADDPCHLVQRLAELPIHLPLLGHWFSWRGPIPSPVREGHDASATIDYSYGTSTMIDEAVREAMDKNKGSNVP